jgi:signal peptidase I
METEQKGLPPQSLLRRALIGRNPKRTALRIVMLVVVCYVLFFSRLVLIPIRIEGISMSPTFSDHSVHFINRLPFFFHEPGRGDVVAVVDRHLAGSTVPSQMLLKRIVGLPGDSVRFHRGAAYVNGQMLAEPYVKLPCDWEIAPRQLGPTEYLVIGDNRSMSPSDHTYGAAYRKQIFGKILL